MKVGLNVGSGQRPFKSVFDEVQWINVDAVEKWSPDLVCDGAHLPYPDEYADYFVLHHVLEHFGLGEGAGLVKEANRVLKPGGSLIACVPNMRALAERWITGEISEYIFMVNTYGAYMGHEEDRHKFGFTAESLAEFIYKNATWKQIVSPIKRDPIGSSIAHDWWILEVEAVK